jgi:hypothetical protein
MNLEATGYVLKLVINEKCYETLKTMVVSLRDNYRREELRTGSQFFPIFRAM